MDKYGQGVEFQFCNIMRNKGLDFNNFTRQMVLEMCIMSGCDYLPSLPGMGVKRAHGLIKRFKSYQKVGIFKCMKLSLIACGVVPFLGVYPLGLRKRYLMTTKLHHW